MTTQSFTSPDRSSTHAPLSRRRPLAANLSLNFPAKFLTRLRPSEKLRRTRKSIEDALDNIDSQDSLLRMCATARRSNNNAHDIDIDENNK